MSLTEDLRTAAAEPGRAKALRAGGNQWAGAGEFPTVVGGSSWLSPGARLYEPQHARIFQTPQFHPSAS